MQRLGRAGRGGAPSATNRLLIMHEQLVAWSSRRHRLAWRCLGRAPRALLERRVVDEGVARRAERSPAAGELAESQLGGGVLELLAGESREEPADALADGALRVEHSGAQPHVRPLRLHDAGEDVFEQRLEERRGQDDDDLVLAVGVVAPDARVEPAQPVGWELPAMVA